MIGTTRPNVSLRPRHTRGHGAERDGALHGQRVIPHAWRFTRGVLCAVAIALAVISGTSTPCESLFCERGLVTLSAQTPARVVSVVPAITEMLYAMGAQDTVVGVSSFDRFPPAVLSKPKVGGLLDPNLEAMLALRPTAAVVHASQTDLQRQLARAGVKTFVYAHTGLSGISAQARDIGAYIGWASAGAELAARIDRDVARIRASYATRPRPRTLLVIGRDFGAVRNVLVSGGVGFLHDMLEAAGATNAMADAARENVQISTETLLSRDPDVILEIGGSDARTGTLDSTDWNVLPPRPGGRTRRTIALDGGDITIPGPRVASAIARLAEAVHGAP